MRLVLDGACIGRSGAVQGEELDEKFQPRSTIALSDWTC